MDLWNAATIRDLFARHGFSFSGKLGQNFLVNPSVCPRMAQACGAGPETGVLEIGPGVGVLTVELSKRAKKVVAVEIDRRLKPLLKETLSPYENAEVVFGDVMELELNALLRERFLDCKEVVVCANLPYYITSPILMHLLESRLPVSRATVMVQKEAAARLCAPVGSRESGAVTAAVNYYARAEKLFSVSAGSFLPPPKVDSAVISLEIREKPPFPVDDEAYFFRMVKAAFAQRRKTLPNALSAGMGLPKAGLNRTLDRCGISPTARAESLSMEALCELANQLKRDQSAGGV